VPFGTGQDLFTESNGYTYGTYQLGTEMKITRSATNSMDNERSGVQRLKDDIERMIARDPSLNMELVLSDARQTVARLKTTASSLSARARDLQSKFRATFKKGTARW
jgi:hypothetical protein